MVLLQHGMIRCGATEDGAPLIDVIRDTGHCAVLGFFILSGFVLVHVYQNRVWCGREFTVNRFARIYPLYLLGLLFALPLDWFSTGKTELFPPETKGESLALSLGLLQSWFPFSNGRFNGPGWTLSVEALFYALFPLLFLMYRRSLKVFVGLVIAVTVVTGIFWNWHPFYGNHWFPAMRVWEFMLGMLCAVLFRVPSRIRMPEIVCIGMILIAPFAARWLGPFGDFAKWLGVAFLSGGAFIFLARRDLTGAQGGILTSRWMVLGGEISYGLYLIHDGVQRYAKVAFERLLHHPLNTSSIPEKTGYMLVTTVISIVLAYVSWKWLEIPLRGRIRKWFHKPKATAPTKIQEEAAPPEGAMP